MNDINQLPRLYATTIVHPSEYDIDDGVRKTIELANKDYDGYLPIDVGKFVGLYLAYKELLDEKNNSSK